MSGIFCSPRYLREVWIYRLLVSSAFLCYVAGRVTEPELPAAFRLHENLGTSLKAAGTEFTARKNIPANISPVPLGIS